MTIFNNIAIIGAAVFLLGGCGIASRSMAPPSRSAPNNGSQSRPVAAAVTGYAGTRASLMQAYRDWKGTPYRLGGTSSGGVDCSSFVRIVFDDYFGIDLPGNTRKQLYAGSGIRRGALRTGDLVFFKTGRKTMHVGIIIESDEFLHASTSQGVTISNLGNRYWASRYLASRRVM